MANVSSSNSQKAFVPKLRFRSKDGAEYPHLTPETVGSLFAHITRRNSDMANNNVITNSAEYGLIPQRDFFDKDIAVEGNTDKYYIIGHGDFVYNPRKSTTAPYGPFNCYSGEEEGIVSPLYTCLKPLRPELTDYLLWYFRSPAWHSYIYHNGAQGGARHDRVGMTNDLMDGIPINLPCQEEQQKISEFLTILEKRLSTQQQLVDALKLYKRGLVRRIFPQKESLQPELRMTTYSGPWHSAKIGDLGSVLMCKRIYKEQTSTSGEVPFYKIGTFGGTADAYIPRELFMEYKAKYPYPQKGDVLISASGSIGRTVVFSGKDEYFQDSNIIWVRFDGTITNPFWKHLCEQLTWVGIEGSTIKRLYNDNVLNTRISFPAIEEQKSISELLDRIDSGICQAEEVTSALVTMKNALMQQLFI